MSKKLTLRSENETGMLKFVREKRNFRRYSHFDNDYEYIKTKNAYFEKYFEKTKIGDQVIQELVNDLRIAKIEYKLQPKNRILSFFFLGNHHYIKYNHFGYFTVSSHYQDFFRLPVKITAQDSAQLIDKLVRFGIIHPVCRRKLLEKKA